MFKKLFGFGKKKKEEIQDESVEEVQDDLQESNDSEVEEEQNEIEDVKMKR